MVVECIGLPGSGKTFLFRSVEEELLRRGIPCVNGGDRIIHSFLWKAARKVLHRTIFLSRDARQLKDRLRQILRQAGPLESRYGIYTDERFTTESAAIFAMAYRRMEKSAKVYLFDEGLVHTIVKFCAEFHLTEEIFLEMLAACGPFREELRIVVYNEISIEDCLMSIQKRNRHTCGFDELSEEKLRELLGEYSRLDACYAAHYPVLRVLRTEDGEVKRSRICREILRVRS